MSDMGKQNVKRKVIAEDLAFFKEIAEYSEIIIIITIVSSQKIGKKGRKRN